MLFLASEESGIMLSLLRTILMTLCNVVYKLIIVMYDLFMAIGSATLLTSEQIQIIYNRVGLILGIVMIFRLMFSFIQYMIDPDKISDKESGVGSLIKKVIVVILALGLTDWVFNKAFEIQDIILEENTIGKVVLGVSSNDDVGMEEFGAQFSYELFSNFFYQNPEVNEDGEAKAANIGCGSDFFSTDLKRYVGTYKDFEAVHKCLNEDGDPDGKTFGNKVYYASFDGLEALLIGGVVLWVLLMYTITLAVRVVKLAFLRIIAPIPILSYIAPKKETAFQKWIKQCVTTYLDLFIRLAIIYFCMLLISIIFVNNGDNAVSINASTYLTPSNSLYKWFRVILVLGILIFAKKIPEILGEIFPSLGGKGGLDFGLGLKSRTDFLGKGAFKRAAGAAVGAGAIGALGLGQGLLREDKDGNKVTGKKKLKNAMTGMGTGFFRGAATGLTNGGKIGAGFKKGFKGQVAASQATNKYISAGSDGMLDRAKASFASTFGLPSEYEHLNSGIRKKERRINDNDRVGSTAKGVYSKIDALGDLVKGEITGDKSNLLISSKNVAALEQLEKAGFATIERKDGKIVKATAKFGSYSIRNSDGTVSTKNIDGPSLLDTQLTKIDNLFESELVKADNKLNTANSNLVNAKTDLVKINSRLANNPNDANLIAERKAKEVEIQILQNEVDNATIERNAFNKTEFEKALKKAAVSEAMLGTYDSDDAKQIVREIDNNVNISIKTNEEIISKLNASVDVEDNKIASQFTMANQTMSALGSLYSDIIYNPIYKTDDGYDISAINDAIKKFNEKNELLLKNAINFDDVLPDGSYGTKEIKIDSVYAIADSLSEMTKKLERSRETINSRLKGEVEIEKNSLRMLNAKNADENRQQWGP